MPTPIEVVPYDPAWPGQFAAVASELGRILAAVPHQIEHVGSTSVPGLAAKPVLDIDIVVASSDLPLALSSLQKAGCTRRGSLGIPGREAIASPPHDGIKRHIYVCVAGCLALRNHLAVRDGLRRREDLRDEYAATKRRLATETDDVDVYVEGKSAVLQRILEVGGISAEERDSVLDVNRAPAA